MPYQPLNDSEVATILHALRMLQRDGCDHLSCDHFEDAPRLTDVEIDDLCERINFDRVSIDLDAGTEYGMPDQNSGEELGYEFAVRCDSSPLTKHYADGIFGQLAMPSAFLRKH